eukprot:gene6119-1094_t
MPPKKQKRSTPNSKPLAGRERGTGKRFKDPNALWAKEEKEGWNDRVDAYWKTQAASVDGVLGGLTRIEEADVKHSHEFIHQMFPKLEERRAKYGKLRALDCGAGIGRVTRDVLCKYFDCTDLLEQAPHMLKQAKSVVPADKDKDTMTAFGCSGLACSSLILRAEYFIDREDHSVTRAHIQHMKLFQEAGLAILLCENQKDFPTDMYPTVIYGLSDSGSHLPPSPASDS